MIYPSGADSFAQSMQMGSEIFHNLKKILRNRNLNTAVGDEGGFAPNLKSNEEAIEVIIHAIEKDWRTTYIPLKLRLIPFFKAFWRWYLEFRADQVVEKPK